MFKKAVSADEVAELVLLGFGQILQNEDSADLLRKAESSDANTFARLGVQYVCFWLYLAYAELRAADRNKADAFIDLVITKITGRLNETGDNGFLEVIKLKPEIIKSYLSKYWVNIGNDEIHWMNDNHQTFQLKDFKDESWLGQLTLLLSMNTFVTFEAGGKKIEGLERIEIYSSCASTSIAYGNVFVGKFKNHKLKMP